jgi:hypothetical protein
MNSLTAHRIVIGSLAALLAVAALVIHDITNDGNPVHFRMTSYIPAAPATSIPVSVVAGGAWKKGINPECVTKGSCYVALEYVASIQQTDLLDCSSAEGCFSINTPPSTAASPPFTVFSGYPDGVHHQEPVNGQFIIIFSAKPIVPPTSAQ